MNRGTQITPRNPTPTQRTQRPTPRRLPQPQTQGPTPPAQRPQGSPPPRLPRQAEKGPTPQASRTQRPPPSLPPTEATPPRPPSQGLAPPQRPTPQTPPRAPQTRTAPPPQRLPRPPQVPRPASPHSWNQTLTLWRVSEPPHSAATDLRTNASDADSHQWSSVVRHTAVQPHASCPTGG